MPPRTAASYEVKADHRLLGALILATAGIWIAVPLLALAAGRNALPSLGIAGSWSLVAVGIAQMLWALDLLRRRQTLIIGENALQVVERRLLRVQHWREPLARFRGLRHRRERIRLRHGWRVVHRLELVHVDPAKTICLISTNNEHRLIAAAHQWGEWSSLPAWSATPRGARSRAGPIDTRRHRQFLA